jgi:hypothetical protein
MVNSPYVTSRTSYLSAAGRGTGVNKFMPDSGDTDGYTDLMLLIFSIDTLIAVCLSITIILFIMLLFKFYLGASSEEKVKFNLSSLIGQKLNLKFNHYFIKLIQLNKKTNNVYIFICFILLFIGLGFNCYFISELYNNLD